MTRKELAAMFPGKRLKIRFVDFTDLARGGAYFLTVLEADGTPINARGCYDREWLTRYAPVFNKLTELRTMKPTYKDAHLIPEA